ncbi:MAG: Hpt domain-containing protein [Silvanigrellales bacterium]|nr:Hpt domain-containing protein [Silvanigrellales bacterium]
MDFIPVFILEANETLEAWERMVLRRESGAFESDEIDTLFRFAHNLKGSALSVGLNAFGQHLHGVEEILSKLRAGQLTRGAHIATLLLEVQGTLTAWVEALGTDAAYVPPHLEREASRIAIVLSGNEIASNALERPTPTQAQESVSVAASPPIPASVEQVAAQNATMRVSLRRLDDLLNLVGELVVDQSMMQRHRVSHTTASPECLRTISHMAKTIQDIQSLTMGLRMTPLEGTFQKLQRATRIAAQQLGKKVDVHLSGGEVELDKVIVDRLGDTLVHIVNLR